MKAAFVGKGGSGKTTLASMVTRYLTAQSLPVIAIDADINQHLGYTLGLSTHDVLGIPAMGLEINLIKEYLRGSNAHIPTSTEMIKTTPPGTGSRLMRVTEQNPLYEHFAKEVDGARLLVVGPFTQEDLGTRCYHSKTGSVELILNHLIDTGREYVIVDMTAGADSFASGLFTRFDITFLVVEPTMKSVQVYKQYKNYAREYDVCIRVIGNKIEDESDVDFIRTHVGDDLLSTFSHSPYIRKMEKGTFSSLQELEPENKQVLADIIQTIDAQKKNWDTYYQQAVLFHRLNAQNWANATTGTDLTTQIDQSFSLTDAIRTL
jgi:CO dehydrogenase maturation factor